MTREQVEAFTGGDMRQANLLCRTIAGWRSMSEEKFTNAVLGAVLGGQRRDTVRRMLT
jgi:hypothetical protein